MRSQALVPLIIRAKPLMEEPRLTIGITAHNEAPNIGRLLVSLLEEINPRDEVIVVASGCTDETVQVVLGIKEEDPRVRLVVEPVRNGKARATNMILASCNGDFILLISADVIPQKGSLREMVATMVSDSTAGMVSSRPVPINSMRGLAGYLGHLYWRLHHRTLTALDLIGSNTHGGEAILVRRGIVRNLPEDCINDDAYIGVRAARKGYRVRYCPRAIVQNKAPETIFDLIGQRRRVIAGHFKVRKQTGQYPRVLSTMIVVDPMKAIVILAEELVADPRSIHKFLAAIYLEALSGCLAIGDRIFRRKGHVWKPARTTKFLVA